MFASNTHQNPHAHPRLLHKYPLENISVRVCIQFVCIHPSTNQLAVNIDIAFGLLGVWNLKQYRSSHAGLGVVPEWAITLWPLHSAIVLIQHLIVDKLQGKVPELIKSEPFVWKSASSSTRLGKLFFQTKHISNSHKKVSISTSANIHSRLLNLCASDQCMSQCPLCALFDSILTVDTQEWKVGPRKSTCDMHGKCNADEHGGGGNTNKRTDPIKTLPFQVTLIPAHSSGLRWGPGQGEHLWTVLTLSLWKWSVDLLTFDLCSLAGLCVHFKSKQINKPLGPCS